MTIRVTVLERAIGHLSLLFPSYRSIDCIVFASISLFTIVLYSLFDWVSFSRSDSVTSTIRGVFPLAIQSSMRFWRSAWERYLIDSSAHHSARDMIWGLSDAQRAWLQGEKVSDLPILSWLDDMIPMDSGRSRERWEIRTFIELRALVTNGKVEMTCEVSSFLSSRSRCLVKRASSMIQSTWRSSYHRDILSGNTREKLVRGVSNMRVFSNSQVWEEILILS